MMRSERFCAQAPAPANSMKMVRKNILPKKTVKMNTMSIMYQPAEQEYLKVIMEAVIH